MPRHPYFALDLLDDDQLKPYVSSPIITRQTIHEWPLSCVQRVDCADGTQYIYKSQVQPSVEAAVYRTVRAPHLLPATVINDQHIILPYIASLDQINNHVDIAQGVLAHIATMPPYTPVYRTLDTIHAWSTLMDATVATLWQLVNSATFTHLTRADVTRIVDWAEHRDVYALWRGPIGVVHGDLSASNILHTTDQAYVIDWQRPLYAPTVIDRWMIEQAFQLPSSTPPMTDTLCVLLEIVWLTEAASLWFPAGASHYDRQITALTQMR
ncbi:MAG: phosphotransferase [Roseiflexaceae bacterium]